MIEKFTKNAYLWRKTQKTTIFFGFLDYNAFQNLFFEIFNLKFVISMTLDDPFMKEFQP